MIKAERAVPVLSAFVIGALTIHELPAQGPPALSALQAKADYSLNGSAICLHMAFANSCRNPQSAPVGFNADLARAGPLSVEDAGGSVRVQGDASAVRVEARQTTIANVLFALATAFNIRYRSSMALDEVLDVTYAGSLTYVISRVLDGYSYVIRYDNSELNVMILAKRGEREVSAPPAAPIRRGRCSCPVIWSPPFATRLSRQNRCACGP